MGYVTTGTAYRANKCASLPSDRERLYRRVRRNARYALLKVIPGPAAAARRIAVVGLPRSGTSWIAKVIACARNVSYYYEPDVDLPLRYYHTIHAPPPQDVVQRIDRSLEGKVTDEYVTADMSLWDILARPLAQTVLVKWVRMSMSLAWVAERHPDLTVIQVVRHPVPQFLSWRARGWSPEADLERLRAQTALLEGPLRRHASVIHKAGSYWEKAGALWGAVATMQIAAHRPGWVLREHEWFCLDPLRRFRQLVDWLGLTWTPAAEEFLSPWRRQVCGPGYGPWRDSRQEIRKWEGEITPAELKQLRDTLIQFDLPFYPGLEPEPGNASLVETAGWASGTASQPAC
jgi:hypothetical protein